MGDRERERVCDLDGAEKRDCGSCVRWGYSCLGRGACSIVCMYAVI